MFKGLKSIIDYIIFPYLLAASLFAIAKENS